jgi:hypothetical protein
MKDVLEMIAMLAILGIVTFIPYQLLSKKNIRKPLIWPFSLIAGVQLLNVASQTLQLAHNQFGWQQAVLGAVFTVAIVVLLWLGCYYVNKSLKQGLFIVFELLFGITAISSFLLATSFWVILQSGDTLPFVVIPAIIFSSTAAAVGKLYLYAAVHLVIVIGLAKGYKEAKNSNTADIEKIGAHEETGEIRKSEYTRLQGKNGPTLLKTWPCCIYILIIWGFCISRNALYALFPTFPKELYGICIVAGVQAGLFLLFDVRLKKYYSSIRWTTVFCFAALTKWYYSWYWESDFFSVAWLLIVFGILLPIVAAIAAYLTHKITTHRKHKEAFKLPRQFGVCVLLSVGNFLGGLIGFLGIQ